MQTAGISKNFCGCLHIKCKAIVSTKGGDKKNESKRINRKIK